MREKLLGVEEASEMLGRTRNGIRRMVERRQLPFRKNGKRLLFLESELLGFIEALPGVSLEEICPQIDGQSRRV